MSSSSDPPEVGASGLPSRWVRALGLALLALSGAWLGALPHLEAWARTGESAYFPDTDDLLYLAWSREAVLQGAGRLVDAVHPESGPMMHPWALFIPPAWLGHLLGLDMTGIGPLWRVLAGALIALGFFVAVRPAVPGFWLAWGLAAFLTFDPGVLSGEPLKREVLILLDWARGGIEALEGVPRVMPHLRVVTPGLAIPFLLLHYGLVLQARRSGSQRVAVGAAVSFGLLFYLYFYFWTVVAAGSALALVLDRAGRKLHAITLAGGLALGLPALWDNYRTKALTGSDWLSRTDKFVPIGHFEELLIPKWIVIGWVLTAFWVFARRRDLSYLWCCTGAGLLCLNHQLITGLQIENFHWIQITGLTFSLLLVLLVVPWLLERSDPLREVGQARSDGRRSGIRGLLLALVLAQVALGSWMRWREAGARETRRLDQIARQLRQDDLPIPEGAMLAGDPLATALLAAQGEVYPLSGRLVEYSSLATDEDLDERLILNLFLSGVVVEEARRKVQEPAGSLSRESRASRSLEIADRQAEQRLALIDQVFEDPRPLLKSRGVTHILLPEGADAVHLDGLADQVADGNHWELWRLSLTEAEAGAKQP
ncbi:hypothetical protein BH23PLA1_BH23PLA1_19950 [soil metagenome]